MKRKHVKSLKKYATRERVSDMVFTFTYYCDTQINIAPVFFGDTRYPTDDLAHCGVFLSKPLSISDNIRCTLDVYYAGKDPIGRGRIRMVVCQPKNSCVVSLEDKFIYNVLPTHALRLDLSNTKTFNCIEFTIQNTQLITNDNTPMLELVVDITPWFHSIQNVGAERFISQQYYPADPTVMEALELVNAQDVPQRTPYWFKLRGKVTGSKAYKMCGFFQGQSTFNAIALKRMRFGRLREDFACMLYLQHVPQHVKVQMVGLVPYSGRTGWGASPDGLIIDSEMSWDDVPTWTKAEYGDLDITRGALEIKCSQANCLMRDYYYPQVYLEMMSLGAVWADVVRYSEQKVSDGNGVWTTQRTCRIYRIYRHKPTEEQLVSCIITALQGDREALYNNPSGQFVAIRSYFKDLASRAQYTEVDVSCSAPLFNSYISHIEDHQKVDLPIDKNDEEPAHKCLTLSADIEERQLEILHMYEHDGKATKELFAHVIAQIRDLLSILEEKIN